MTTTPATTPTASRSRVRNRRGEGDRLRGEILTAATRMIEEAGSDEGLTLRGVAKRTGISAQSIYLHFPDLTALVLAVLADCHHDMGAAMNAAADAAPDPVGRIVARGRAYLKWGMEHPGLYQTMYEGRVQAAHDPGPVPPGRLLLLAASDDVAAAIRAGAVPEGDPERIAVQLWALVHGLVSLRANKPHFPWPDLLPVADEAGRRILGVTP